MAAVNDPLSIQSFLHNHIKNANVSYSSPKDSFEILPHESIRSTITDKMTHWCYIKLPTRSSHIEGLKSGSGDLSKPHAWR